MVQQAFGDIERLKAEVKRLRGRLDAFSVGGAIIPHNIIGGTQIPLPIEGAIIFGTSIPDWGRLPPPATGDDYALKYLDAAIQPSWELDTSGGIDEVFVINMASAL